MNDTVYEILRSEEIAAQNEVTRFERQRKAAQEELDLATANLKFWQDRVNSIQEELDE